MIYDTLINGTNNTLKSITRFHKNVVYYLSHGKAVTDRGVGLRTYVSWNVNGLRACIAKGAFETFLEKQKPDIICLQEIKLQAGQIELDLPAYRMFWNYAEKKGYSGTAVFVKEDIPVVRDTYGMGIEEHDREGRIITLELDDRYLVCVYTPNSKQELERLEYRMRWEDDFLAYCKKLEKQKPVIFCGDLNVAHREIDLKNPSSNHHSAGFTDEERGKFQALLDAGFVDTFRCFYPDREGAYTWWSYRFQARKNNAGWRIDYFLVSGALREKLEDALIYADVTGSDHCPVGIRIKD